MKRFFVTMFLVSTFFIGLSALIEQAGAKFRSDARALELIRQTRIAIGGDANINAVRSLTIAANTTHFFEKDGVPQTEAGTLEINMRLPDQFSKMVRIGNPENPDALTEVQKQLDVIVMRKGDESVSSIPSGDGKKVVIVKKADGTVLTEDIRGADGQHKIIIKKDDGTLRELNPGKDGTIVFERKEGGDDMLNAAAEDGRKIRIKKDFKTENLSGNRHNEMFRTTLALLLTAPEGLDVSYTFAGEADVDGSACNVVLARTGGESFKLFLDKSSFLPRMIEYEGREFPRVIRFMKDGSGEVLEERVFELKIAAADAKALTHQIKFSDFRSVGGLLLPHRWTETVGGRDSQNIEITNYEINPADIADKFKGQKVFVRTAEDQ